MLKIGEVSKRAGVGIEALRFYETRGLIEPAARTDSGYRLYDDHVFERLEFVKKAQSVGFSLDEIARIIGESAKGKRPCKDVRAMAARKLAELEQRIQDLETYRDQLRQTVQAWDRKGETGGLVCGLIEGLEPDAVRAPKRGRR